MSDVKYVLPEQYAEIVALLDSARAMELEAKQPGLRLADKLSMLRSAKALREQATAI